ncbi:MAG: glycerol-3-phosphate dehydrogenase/oxidase [Bryobacteraceae bacterium]|nr:glycerol-3-phosphate dehydrogenase/oxidase [Bryobacteraceae bacterium]
MNGTPDRSSGLSRESSIAEVRHRSEPWDFVVVGGGATGVGIALDAASRGYSVALIEQSDFGKGTSSRSTKLVHGGVRYLAQGNFALVREALSERALLLQNAPGLVKPLGCVIPAGSAFEAAWYRTGIGLYDFLAGGQVLGASRWLQGSAVQAAVPGLRTDSFPAGVLFYDGQFDDARLLIAIARTAAAKGAIQLNYCRASRLLLSSGGKVTGVLATDVERGEDYELTARLVINATGAWSDQFRQLADKGPGQEGANGPGKVRVSRGSHIVADQKFLPSENALLIPKTPDGRVLFAIPWLGKTLIGTTDVETENASLDPTASESEIDFILDTAARYLQLPPQRSDIRSVWAGIRPLVNAGAKASSGLSREHAIFSDREGLLTITGGKWTTYRRMAEECVDIAARTAGLAGRPCLTRDLRLDVPAAPKDLEEATRSGVRNEMARTVDDILARRTRHLFLDAAEAVRLAPSVAGVLAAELGRDEVWCQEQIQSFTALGRLYTVVGSTEAFHNRSGSLAV